MNPTRLCFFAAVVTTCAIAFLFPEYVVFGYGPTPLEFLVFLGVVWLCILLVVQVVIAFRRPKRRRVRRQ